MSATRCCEQCGALLPPRAPGGLCPKCLLAQAVHAPAEAWAAEETLSPGVGIPFADTSARRFGDYELLEKVAEGGMGVVYRARQLSLNRIVAVKMIQPGRVGSPEMVLRFRAEAEAAASLHHPNIVPIHETGECGGQHYFSMDYIEGQNLAEAVREGPLPWARAAQLVAKIAAAVHYAHQHGILHRDLKPSNVILDEAGEPQVTDFGLARRLGGDSTLTLTGQVFGSPRFMPPEQASGRAGAVGMHSDVYGLGAILYYLLTARPPFVGESVETTLAQVRERDPVSLRLLNASVPRDLETICLKCLEKEPSRRYASAQAVAEELGRFLEKKPILARPVGLAGKVARWCRRKPALATALGTIVLVAALGFLGILTQWRRAELARQEAVEQLWQACLAQAQANRWSGQAGRRFVGLDAIRQAAAIRPTVELRNEAIACLSLPDARIQSRLQFDRQAGVVGLAFDESFQRYACAYEDSSVSIRRVLDNAELAKLPAQGRIVKCGLLFSPRGGFLARCPNLEANLPCTLWDLSRERLVLTVPFVARSPTFTPDDRQLALAEREGNIHFFDLATGTEVSSFTVAPGVNHLAFDPTGKRLAISRVQNPSVLILDVQSKSVCAALTNTGSVGSVAWSPDGRLLACPSSDGRVYLWNVTTGERKALEGHIGAATGAMFNRLGDMMVSSGWDGMTWFWDPKLGQPLVSLPGGWLPNGFDHSDRSLGFGVDNYKYGSWEVEPARECRRLGRTAALWGGAFSADGRVLATASSDGVRLWQVPLNRLLAHLPVNEARSAIWHPNGTNLITSGAAGVQVWPVELSEGNDVRIGPPRELSPTGQEQGGLTADGRWLVVAYAPNANVAAIDLEHLSPPRLLTGHVGTHFVSISPDGRWFATGTWHGTGVKVWSTETWQPVKELPVNGSARCAFSPDGQWLVTGSPEEYCLWRVGSWEPGLRIPRDKAGDMYGSMALTPDGRMAALLLGRNRGVRLLSIPDGRELATLDTGQPLCFSKDGGQLATMGDDLRTLLVWDLRLIRSQLRSMKLDWD